MATNSLKNWLEDSIHQLRSWKINIFQPAVQRTAQDVMKALSDQGLLELFNQPEATGTKKGQGGRPRNTDDEWARDQVRKLRRPQSEVYAEWLNRIGDRAATLADPHDSFKKVIRFNRGKKGE